MSQLPDVRPPPSPRFTPKQGQYLAFIHAYTQVLGRPPAEADLQRYFRVTPPSVHQMVLTLERAGLIHRQPGVARSIKVLVEPEALPPLSPTPEQLIKSSGRGTSDVTPFMSACERWAKCGSNAKPAKARRRESCGIGFILRAPARRGRRIVDIASRSSGMGCAVLPWRALRRHCLLVTGCAIP
jgi:LexA DNA binding domain